MPSSSVYFMMTSSAGIKAACSTVTSVCRHGLNPPRLASNSWPPGCQNTYKCNSQPLLVRRRWIVQPCVSIGRVFGTGEQAILANAMMSTSLRAMVGSHVFNGIAVLSFCRHQQIHCSHISLLCFAAFGLFVWWGGMPQHRPVALSQQRHDVNVCIYWLAACCNSCLAFLWFPTPSGKVSAIL